MKKKILVLVISIIVIYGLCGCNEHHKFKDSSKDVFPKFLAGQWKPDSSKWILTIDPDGSIPKMRHFIGIDVVVAEGGLIEQWRDNITAMYVLGPCETHYDYKKRELSVKIIVEYYRVDFPDGAMEGSFYDHLRGPVSKDGKQWEVDWISTGEIIGGGSMDPNDVEPKKLIFTKVSE